jgi:hypothetical protein
MREVAMAVLRKTWLATSLFVLVSTAVWWRLIDWSVASKQLLPTLLLTPLMWWFIVGRQARPHLVRGVLAGGLTGFVTQSAQDIPEFLSLFAHRGTGTGEGQLVAGVSMAVFFFFGVVATLGGALLGLTTILIQRRLH